MSRKSNEYKNIEIKNHQPKLSDKTKKKKKIRKSANAIIPSNNNIEKKTTILTTSDRALCALQLIGVPKTIQTYRKYNNIKNIHTKAIKKQKTKTKEKTIK